MLRRPAVAGQFYPAERSWLDAGIARYMEGDVGKVAAKGAIVPHAGIIYSGNVAGAVYSRVEMPGTFVIIGPNHTGRGKPAAVWASGIWQMPGGDIPIDEELARQIIDNSDCLSEDETSHQYEHSIEMQLPFIQYFKRDLKIVPICLKSAAYEVCQDVGQAAARTVDAAGIRALLVASTDMSHYVSQETAQAKDRMAIDKILSLDARGLYEVVMSEGISMCGFMAATAAIVACKELGATKAELVRYATSGDINGDYTHVVGYAGLVIV